MKYIADAIKLTGLSYKTKSFKFELKNFYKFDPSGEGVFIGQLIIPSESQHVFNEKAFIKTLRPRGHFPLLHDHNTHMPLGRIFLSFITWPSIPGHHIPMVPTWDFKATVLLEFEVEKAREIYALIEREKQEAIKELSLGYNVVEGEVILYEGSIEQVKS